MVKGYIVSDLGFGDSGKGTVTDALVKHLGAGWVVRFNGGAQAGHNVVTPDGRHHTFSQFGAGTFHPGVRTYLSRYMVVHPGGLLEEARTLRKKGVEDVFERLHIDSEALIITPFHQAANRLREVLRGDERHGSCGLGVGESMHHSLEHPEECIRAGELHDSERLRRKLCRVQQRYWQEFSRYRRELSADQLGRSEMAVLESFEAADHFIDQGRKIASRVDGVRPRHGPVVFEGAQGVLLDEWRGFHPYTTWSTCTFDNALHLIGEWGGEAVRLGVVRSYATRHGAGPFPTEDASVAVPEPHNGWGPWQEGFRRGFLDLVLLRYAIEACGGLDGLVVTHLDSFVEGWKVAERYEDCHSLWLGPFRDLGYQERLTEKLLGVNPRYRKLESRDDLLSTLARLAPVVMTSHGRTWLEKEFRNPAFFQSLARAG